MDNEYKSCYSCCYHTSEPQYHEVWCSETRKLIDDGFGFGDDTPCKRFLPMRLIVNTGIHEELDQLPF